MSIEEQGEPYRIKRLLEQIKNLQESNTHLRDALMRKGNGFIPHRTNAENWAYKQKIKMQMEKDGFIFGSVMTARDPSKE